MSASPTRRRYPIPTRLTVEPSIIRTELGPVPIDLTFRQAAIQALTAGFLYWLWQGSGWPISLASLVSGVVILLVTVITFVTIGGRSADLWLRAVLLYLGHPRRLAWRAGASEIELPAAPITRVGPPLTVTRAPHPFTAAPDLNTPDPALAVN